MPRATAATPTPAEETEVIVPKTFAEAKTEQESARLSLIDTMRNHFRDQPRRRVKVRNDADVPVQVNGYTFIVAANVPVDVPVEVADLLEEAGYI